MFEARYALIFSIKDDAGVNIAKRISELEHCEKVSISGEAIVSLLYIPKYDAYLASFRDDIVYVNYVDKYFKVNYYIYLSRHSSMRQIKSLTVHYTGNVSKEKAYGANPRELSKTYPPLAKTIISNVRKFARELCVDNVYEVVYEATHHGPTNLSKPLIFVEIGSSPSEWKSKKAAITIAKAVLHSLKDVENYRNCVGVIGIGGGHYSRKHTEYCLKTEVCYSHIFSKHVLSMVDNGILKQALSKTLHPINQVIIEKKGAKSSFKKLIEAFAQEAGLMVKYI